MAFPSDIEIEVAFNNDIDETDYAQSGWTSVLPFVAAFNGTLRGRNVELDRTEAGSIAVVLDNSDGRFLPGSVQSPYYPYVKSDRRFRIRGKNMVHPNVARGGSRDRATTGFMRQIPESIQDIQHDVYTRAIDDVFEITASAAPNPGEGAANVFDPALDTKWTINTMAGYVQYRYYMAITMHRYTLTVPAGNPNNNPDDWTLQGSNNGSSWTTIDTVTANVWSDDYETQEFVIDTPGSYSYYRLDITGNVGTTSNTQLADWRMLWDEGVDLPTGDSDLTYYSFITVNDNLGLNQWYDTEAWYVPLEYGVRLSHSAMVFRIAGTEPTGWKWKLHITYLDGDFNVIDLEGSDPEYVYTAIPTSRTPAQVGFSHTPPSEAKYGVMSFAVWVGGTTNATNIEYGITGIQSELPVNLAPDISGYRDTFNWQIESEGTVPGTVKSVQASSNTGALVETTSPPYKSGNTASIVTDAFIPANNSLLIAMVGFGNGSDGASALGTVSDSLGGTWTRKASDFLTAQGVAEIWMRDVVTGASMTVTYARGGAGTASGLSLQVRGLTGAKTVVNQTGAIVTLGGTTDFEKQLITTFANSKVYGSFARNSAAVALEGNDLTTIYGQIAGTSTDLSAAFSTPIISIPGTVTVGFTNDDVGTNRGVMMEVLATNIVASDPTTAYLSVTWSVDDGNLFITIPHLIPGEWYTATVEAQLVGSQPQVIFTGDEGVTGATITTTTMTQYSTTFLAEQAEQELRFILQATPTAGEGLRLRKLRVERGENLSLSLPTTAIETGVTGWLRPKDIFEGWVESWPAVAGSSTLSVAVNDRMSRIGRVELASTLRESLLVDRPSLLLPLTDSMLDAPGEFSQLGYWGDIEGGPTTVTIQPTKGDVSSASFTTFTDDGPTGEASLKLTTISSTAGYVLTLPYSKDATAPTKPSVPVKPKPPPTKPNPTTPTLQTYTKKWYATWSRSYEGGNGTRFDDSDYMYQGQFSGSPGNQKSLAGFDYKNMMSTLNDAEILSCHVTVTNAHARWNKGLYVFLGWHNIASKPSTWNSSNVNERTVKAWVGEGGSVTRDFGTPIGRAFRDGTAKGISIGPEADSDNYGFFKGAKQSNRPFVTIKYRK